MTASNYRDPTITSGEAMPSAGWDDGGEFGLPPAPTMHRPPHRHLDRLQRTGVGLVIAAAIVPHYLYTFPWLIGQPSFVGVGRVADPISVAGLAFAFAVLLATALRLGVAMTERVPRRGHPFRRQQPSD